MKRIGVIGGGAAGIAAAITAARNDRQAKVFILEKKERIGKKILATGNGRCNLTNRRIDGSLTETCYHGENVRFATEVLEQFGYEDTLRFFESVGLVTKMRGDYVYPRSDQAQTVLELLNLELKRLDVEIICGIQVRSITQKRNEFCIRGEASDAGLQQNTQIFKADRIILACGGQAASVFGSDGSGYRLAKTFGHHIVPVVPALVQLKVKNHPFARAAGVRTDARVAALIDGVPAAADTGELQITAYGISGIPVFQISRHIALGLYQKKRAEVLVDLLPEYTMEEVLGLFMKMTKNRKDLTVLNCLGGIFNQKLVPQILELAKVRLKTRMSELDKRQLHMLGERCKRICLTIQDTNGFENAQVCAGGVRTDEVDLRTMESKKAKGLYLAGELLDVDGICGGYNLQWAWATGCIAGKAAVM